MAYENLQAVVGMALIDDEFRQGLLAKTPSTLQNLGLTADELAIVRSIQATTLQGFARELDRWIRRDLEAIATHY